MQAFLTEYGRHLFIFFIVPLAGLLLEFTVPVRTTAIFLLVLGVFIAPAFMGYSFAFSTLGTISEVLFLSTAYALVARVFPQNIKVYGSVIFSFVLFAALGSVAVMQKEKDGPRIETKWEVGHYRVEYLSDQSFDGGPLLQYALGEYATIPFYLKPLEVVSPPEDMGECLIVFPKSRLAFDRCHPRNPLQTK